jgi:hypothetical protein
MYFDGCALPLGCTVLLRGASAAELTKVKRVVKFGVLAAYHLNLEVTFLAEELTLTTAALASRGEWGGIMVAQCAGFCVPASFVLAGCS